MQQIQKSHNRTLSRLFSPLFFFWFCALLLTSCTSTKVIVNGLEEREANEILVFLSSKNIPAVKIQGQAEGGGGAGKVVLWDISVDADQAAEAMSLLNMYGLPRKKGQSLLGIFSKGGLVPSELEEKIKYQSGLAEQIANTIRKIDGVLDAEVQISIPEENALNPMAEKGKVTASVYVKHTGVLDDPNLQMTPKIKRLVSSSVPSLDYDNVTVVADRARLSEATLTKGESQKDFVSVWSIIIGKESVRRFQTFFITFFIIVILCILFTIWLIWKINPLLQQAGGFKQLFTLKALHADDLIAAQKTAAEEKAKEATPPTEGEEATAEEEPAATAEETETKDENK
jgi:type III secretion protein J